MGCKERWNAILQDYSFGSLLWNEANKLYKTTVQCKSVRYGQFSNFEFRNWDTKYYSRLRKTNQRDGRQLSSLIIGDYRE